MSPFAGTMGNTATFTDVKKLPSKGVYSKLIELTENIFIILTVL